MSSRNAKSRGTSIVRFAAFVPLLYALCSWSTLCCGQEHRFGVRESIEMETFARDPYTGKEEDIRSSPDGRYFSALTLRGLLQSNELQSTIWIFDSSEAKKFINAPSPVRAVNPTPLARMAAPSSGDPITEVRWSADSRGITFLGRDRNSARRLFTVNLDTGRLQQLSPEGKDVTAFDCAEDTCVFSAASPVDGSEIYQSAGSSLRDIQIGTGVSLFSLLYPKWEPIRFGVRPQQLWTTQGGKASPVANAATSEPVSFVSSSFMSLLSISPNGHYAVITSYVKHIPEMWEQYEPAYISSFTKIVADSSEPTPTSLVLRPVEYGLVNLESGELTTLVDAPLGLGAGYPDPIKVAWSDNEREIALSNTFLPLVESGSHMTRPCIAVVELKTRKAECVKESHPFDLNKFSATPLLSDILWRRENTQLVLRYSKPDGPGDLPPELFQRQDGTWKPIDDPAVRKAIEETPSRAGVSVAVHQTLNESPVLIGTDIATKKSRCFWDPNPQLAGINLGEAIVYHWHDTEKHEWTGGLVKPPDYVHGHRYPLVIQTHGFNPSAFLTEGFYTTANAARSLASRGIVVLQVKEIITDAHSTPREATENGRAGYESAIEQLAADGIVDPGRVGIIGFSRTGWYVLESLIHSPNLFLAATLAESTYASFGEYLVNADYLGRERAKGIAELVGSEPFGEGLKTWLAASPGFNTEKIRVPILFEENDPVALIYNWDVYAALRLQGRPVELLYIRNGDHILRKPLQRLASQEMNLDWYDFWLNGHEDPDPAKAEQYKRWRELRKLQQQNEAK